MAGRPQTINRVLLKISGEALCRPGETGLDPEVARLLAKDIAKAKGLGVEIVIVVGGGNLIRGASFAAMGTN